MGHPIDPRFAPEEGLIRRVRAADVDLDGHLKRRALRPQVSVCRDTLDGVSAALKLPGDHLAVTAVLNAREATAGAVGSIVLHDPTQENPSHALIAMHTLAGPDTDLHDDREQWRAQLARTFTVTR